MYDLLKGLRVVEAAAFIAGPSCGLHLAQMGAEVIRIDNLGGGPDFHRWPRATTGESLYWEGLNKAKKSVALNLSRPEGRELAIAIACAPGENAGLFVTNFPARGFLAYETLKARRDDLICARIMGWPDGRSAVDYTVNSAVGVPMMTGPVESAAPVNHVLPAWDLLTGAYAAFALLSAERARRADGQGREVRVPLSDMAVWSLGALGQIAETTLSGQDRPRTGNDLFGAFGRDFVTQDGRRLMIVAITPRQWAGLVEALEIGPAVSAVEAARGVAFTEDEGLRFVHRDALVPLVEAAVARLPAAELERRFDAHGVCWSHYRTLSEALRDEPAFSEANPLLSLKNHASGAYLTPDAAATLSGAERQAEGSAPVLGQDTEAVLTDVVGLSGAEIARLCDAGVIAPERSA